MRILITGAGGFIGSHLVEECVIRGHRVRAFVRYNSMNRWGWLEESPVRDDVEVVSGDVRDYDSVHAATAEMECVLHLAALIGIPYSYESPLAYIRTNVEGSYNVLESARRRGLSQVLVTSTSETYGTARYVPIDEEHPAVGQSPYAATKIAADQLALSYYRSFDLPVKVVRPFNTYGPRQSARAVVPTIVAQVLAGKTELSLGNLAPTRDFTYVRDTVAGFLAILEADTLVGTATNIGMDQEISVADLVRLIGELTGREIQVETERRRVRPEFSEVDRLRCDNRRVLSATDWRPAYDLRSGLTETVDWLRSHLERYKPHFYNI